MTHYTSNPDFYVAHLELITMLTARKLLIPGSATTAKKASLPNPLYVYCTKMLLALSPADPQSDHSIPQILPCRIEKNTQLSPISQSHRLKLCCTTARALHGMSVLESGLAVAVSSVLRPLPSFLCREWRVRLRDHRRCISKCFCRHSYGPSARVRSTPQSIDVPAKSGSHGNDTHSPR
jgi:hypothetical protein